MSTLIRYVVNKRGSTALRLAVLFVSFASAIGCFATYALWGFGIPSMLCSVFLALWLGVLTGVFIQQLEPKTTAHLDLVSDEGKTLAKAAACVEDGLPAEAATGSDTLLGPGHYDVVVASWSSDVELVSERYALSARERDVLGLLVRGRDTARISEALCISPHTVKSHLYSIYRKAGVHSSQEIIDVFEELCFADAR